MPDDNQNLINLPEGILIKTQDGMKKVQAGKVTDFKTAGEKKEGTILKSPDFYYHPDDEEEIKLQQDKLKIIEEKPTVMTPEAIVEKIIQKNNLNFTDEVLKRRFFNIIQSRLIDVRDSIETEEILMRSTKIGGMGFEQNLVYKIMQDVENEAVKIHEFKQTTIEPTEITKTTEKKEKIFPPGIPRAEEKEKEEVSPTPQAPPPIAFAPAPSVIPESMVVKEGAGKELERREVQPEIIVQKEIKPTEEVPYIKVKDFSQPQVKKIDLEEKIKEIEKFEKKVSDRELTQMVKEGAPIKKPPMPRVLRPIMPEEEPKVTDIKLPRKIIGPVEELQDLSLIDFRRLGRDLNEIIDKIKEKVKLLEEESFSLMTQGIEAWRNSEVNKQYIEMGKESIEKNKSIGAIIEGKKMNNLSYLTKEEFLAIADLNKHLNY